MEEKIKCRGRYKPFEILDLSHKSLVEIDKILATANSSIKMLILPQEIAVNLSNNQISNLPMLREIIWPKANKITGYLFYKSKLKYVSIGECEKIEEYAFASSKITEIKLPHKLQAIGKSAFSSCTNLIKVDMSEIESPIYIPSHCFYNNPKLTEIDFNKISSLGSCAFSKTGFTSVSIPSTIKVIGDSAFSHSNITSLTINSDLEFEGDSQFSGCINLQEVNFNNNISSIPDNCFWCCNNLKAIINAESIKKIGSSAFNETDITQINMPALEEIGAWAFRLSSLNKIEIPKTVTRIGMGAFCSCKKLKEVHWNISCKKIEDYTFHSCIALAILKGFESVEKIGHRTFEKVIGNVEFSNLKAIKSDSFSNFIGTADLRKTAFIYDDNEMCFEKNVLLPYFI